jgi:hypothetical protein
MAIATFALAAVTLFLGWQARSQVLLSREIESNRQAETHILEADPLHVELLDWNTRNAADEQRCGFKIRAIGDEQVTAIQARSGRTRPLFSESPGVASLPPGSPDSLEFRWARFDLLDHCQIVIESHGLLGQRVIQTYRLRPDRIRSQTGALFSTSSDRRSRRTWPVRHPRS